MRVCVTTMQATRLRMSAVVIMQSRHDQCSSNSNTNNNSNTRQSESQSVSESQSDSDSDSDSESESDLDTAGGVDAAGSSQRTHFSGHVANVVGHNELKVWEGGGRESRKPKWCRGRGLGRGAWPGRCLASCVQDMQCLSSCPADVAL